MRDVILRPLKDHGQDGIGESVKAMEFYSLMREDLDNLIEVTTWPDQNDPMKAIETKVNSHHKMSESNLTPNFLRKCQKAFL